MLSSQLVSGLSVLCVYCITNTPAAFLMQPYCHLLSWEETACLFALLCILYSVFHPVLKFCLLFIFYLWILKYKLCPLQAIDSTQRTEVCECVCECVLLCLTGRVECRHGLSFCLDLQLHVVGSQADLFLTYSVLSRINMLHSCPILHVVPVHTHTHLTSPHLTVTL